MARQSHGQVFQHGFLFRKVDMRAAVERGEQMPPAAPCVRRVELLTQTLAAKKLLPQRFRPFCKGSQLAVVPSPLQSRLWASSGGSALHAQRANKARAGRLQTTLGEKRSGAGSIADAANGPIDQFAIKNGRAEQIVAAERHFDSDMYPRVALAKAATPHQRKPRFLVHEAALNEGPKEIDLAIRRAKRFSFSHPGRFVFAERLAHFAHQTAFAKPPISRTRQTYYPAGPGEPECAIVPDACSSRSRST